MRIESVAAQNFKSYPEFFLDIPEPGLYLITGRNKADAKIGSNGAGKSTILDALSWCLTGKTTRGLGGPSVQPWNGDVDQVEVSVDIGGKVVSRARNPIEERVDGQLVSAGTLEAEYGKFLDVCLYPQFGESFLDLTPARKLEVFDALLNIPKWEERASTAKSEASKFSVHKASLIAKKGASEAWLEHSEERLRELGNAREHTSGEFAELTERLSELKRAWSGLNERKEVMERRMERDEEELGELKHEHQRLWGEEASVGKDWNAIAEDRKAVKKKITKLDIGLKGERAEEVCPVCYSKINPDPEYVSRLRKHYEEELAEIDKDELECEGKLEEIGVKLQAVSEKLKKAKERSDAQGSVMARIREEVDVNEKEGRLASKKLDDFLSREKEEAARREEIQKSVDGYEKEIKELDEQINDTEVKLHHADYWGQGFTFIRLMVIREAVDRLTVLTNKALEKLGLKGWEVRYEKEKVTKSGSKSRKLFAFVRSPAVKEEVPWGAWSGGEAQRLRIASYIAMNDLLSSCHELNPGVEFWDEPTRHLSGDGVDGLLDYLSVRAQSAERAIFVIDHHRLEYPFDAVYEVEKNSVGESLIS